ncbi:MAG TPA: hypothetical protein EYG08_03090 [Myxococcales bacterium]|nr:hypothetical protein [Myxococcales bacterium]
MLATSFVVGSLWWVTRDTPDGRTQSAVGQQGAEFSSPNSAESDRIESPVIMKPPHSENELEAMERANSRSRIRGLSGRQNSLDRRGAVDRPNLESDRSAETEGELRILGHESSSQLLNTLRKIARGEEWVGSIDWDRTALNSEELRSLDLDQDGFVAESEVEKALKLVERAERFPVNSDFVDGSYPIERENSRRPEWEFEVVDTNRDDRIEIEEYLSFLLVAESTKARLDGDGDLNVSFEESGLSADEFAPLDRDGDRTLRYSEIRRAIAFGAFDQSPAAE